MANLKAIKQQIKSVGNIKKITKALEIVSTVKLKKVKNQTDNYKTYLEWLLEIVSLIKDKVDLFDADMISSTKELYIIVSSEKGLCGSLNSKLLKMITPHITEETEIFAIGKKAIEFSKRTSGNTVQSLHLKDNFTEADLLELQTFLSQALESKKYWRITLCYNHFQSTMVQLPVSLQLLPLNKESIVQFTQQVWIERTESEQLENKDLELEPSADEFKEQLQKLFIKHVIYWAILQNKTGEFASRMLAMKNATDNSWNMIKSLKLTFNKARQAAITQEISEITSAKMSMEQ